MHYGQLLCYDNKILPFGFWDGDDSEKAVRNFFFYRIVPDIRINIKKDLRENVWMLVTGWIVFKLCLWGYLCYGGNVAMVTDNVKKDFEHRFKQVLDLIKSYNISYEETGIFGSYARGDYKGFSDIDFCIITANKPDRRTSGSLREEADMLGADIIYVTREYFDEADSKFAVNLRRDYRRVL